MMNALVILNKYDARALAFRISYQSNIRESSKYQDALDDALDATMSCNHPEAAGWLVRFMDDAVKFGIATKSPDWKHRFLAAYDVYSDL